MVKQITKKENIKQLWGQLNNDGAKTKFINECANEFKRSARTIRQWWFSETGSWSVPEDFQDRVIGMLQITIAMQNK